MIGLLNVIEITFGSIGPKMLHHTSVEFSIGERNRCEYSKKNDRQKHFGIDIAQIVSEFHPVFCYPSCYPGFKRISQYEEAGKP
jgi:hypothetical protein